MTRITLSWIVAISLGWAVNAPTPALAAISVTSIDQICPPTADPCVISRRYDTTAIGETLDFGARAVRLERGGAIRHFARTLEIEAGRFAMQPGSHVVTRERGDDRGGELEIVSHGRCADDPSVRCGIFGPGCAVGQCVVEPGHLVLGGRIKTSGPGTEGGLVDVLAAGDIDFSGVIDGRSRQIFGDGASIDFDSLLSNVVLAGRINARGGADGTGGEVFVLASGDIIVGGVVDLRGGGFDGGTLDLQTSNDVTIDGAVRASAVRQGGSGGSVDAEVGGDLTLTSRARIAVNGTRGGRFGPFTAGSAGDIRLIAEGDILVESGARIESRGGEKDGGLALIIIDSLGGALRFDGRLVATSGGLGDGAELFLAGDRSVLVGDTGHIETRGGGGGEVDIWSNGGLEIRGNVLLTATPSNLDFAAPFASLDLRAELLLTIAGRVVVTSKRDPTAPAETYLEGCRIRIESGGRVSSVGNDGYVWLDASQQVLLEPGAVVTADESTGDVSIFARLGAEIEFPSGAISPPPSISISGSPGDDCSCGDTEIEEGEECDDGNVQSGDGCDANCTLTGCGNGVTTVGESCDNGDANSDTDPDACRTDCTLPSCGDSVVDSGESCDDGAANSDTLPDACRSDCSAAGCGDDVLDTGEICEDGNTISGDGCDENCTPTACGNGAVSDGEECDDGAGNSDTVSDACRTDCTLPFCGDGVVDSGEECDDALDNDDSTPGACRTDCLLASCGDGVLDGPELCDDGNRDSGDGCDSNCTPTGCGNGVPTAPESCDDGNTVSGDGCSASCECEEGFSCFAEQECPTSVEIVTYAGVGAPCSSNADCVAGVCDASLSRCRTVTDLDLGWVGIAHGMDVADGNALRVALACPVSAPCGVCAVGGIQPAGDRCRCSNDTRTVCDEPFVVDTDDCGVGVCECYVGPPESLSAGNTPACTVSKFIQDITGTIEPATGEREFSSEVRSVRHLGETIFAPCPYCSGDAVANDGVRDGICEAGENDGEPCDVHALDTTFPAPGGAGTSLDCMPSGGKNVSGLGQRRRFSQTTGAPTVGSAVSCGIPPFVTYDCHCGICSNDSSLGCRSDAECDGGGLCEAVANASPLPDQCTQPDSCEALPDGTGTCPDGPDDTYCDLIVRSDGTGLVYCASNADCGTGTLGIDAGTCTLSERRRCFPKTAGASGVADSFLPIVTSLECMAPTSNPGINTVIGLPGLMRRTEQQTTVFDCGPDARFDPSVDGCIVD